MEYPSLGDIQSMTDPKQTAPVDPAFGKGTGLDDNQRSLATSTILWFSDYLEIFFDVHIAVSFNYIHLSTARLEVCLKPKTTIHHMYKSVALFI